MVILYGLLIIVIFLQIVILLKKPAISSHVDQLAGRIEILPELILQKLTVNLLDFSQKLLQEFTRLEQKLAQDFNEFRLNILNQTVDAHTRLNQNFLNFQNELLKQENSSNANLINKFNNFSETLRNYLEEDVNRLIIIVKGGLEQINEKVESRLKDGFESTVKTFNSILERLTRIDEAQKKIEELSSEIISLQDILSDKKMRGIFGEVQLNQILIAVFGENSSKLYGLQYKLTNGLIADAMLLAPEPLGKIAIDAKFPLENYRRMLDNSLEGYLRKEHEKKFEQDIKKHIDDIATKYIVVNETGQQAVMFVPAEAIFAQINAYHHGILDYAQKRQVWLASPTTLMAVLTTIQIVMKNVEQTKHAKIIQENLYELSVEFGRYKERWDDLAKHIDTVSKDVKNIHNTTKKIGTRFDSITKLDILENKLEIK